VHLEILVEDLSGKKALDILIPRLVDGGVTFRVHPYKGIGHIPKNMRDSEDPSRRILLDNLPKLLKGYGRTFANYPSTTPAAVVLVCDLDDKPFDAFLRDLTGVLDACNPAPKTSFCLAIEEGEAWYLGDIPALKSAYPNAKNEVLESYLQDSICGTWETLANAVYTGGERALSMKGWQGIGAEKSRWAENISPRMNVEENNSPSFAFFRNTVRSLAHGR
jgi:hypothetical protein